MSVHILGNDEQAAFFCSTTDWAFGPIFNSDDKHGLDAREVAELFLQYVSGDLRALPESAVLEARCNFLQWLSVRPESEDIDDLKLRVRGLTQCTNCGEHISLDEAKQQHGQCDDCAALFGVEDEKYAEGDRKFTQAYEES